MHVGVVSTHIRSTGGTDVDAAFHAYYLVHVERVRYLVGNVEAEELLGPCVIGNYKMEDDLAGEVPKVL